MRRAWLPRAALAVLITLACLAYVLRIADPAAYLQLLADAEPLPLLLAGLALAAGYLLRALRVALVLGRAPTRPLLRVSILHNLLSAVLPMKLGEAALPWLLQRGQMAALSSGVGVLLGVRLFDVLALGVVAGGILAASGGRLGTAAPWVGGLLALAGLGLALALPVLARAGERLALRLGRRWPRAGSIAMQISSGALGATGRRRLPLLGLSVAAWCFVILAFHVAGGAFGLAATPAESALATSAAAVAFALPINGLAGIGPVQLTWAGVMSGFGHAYAPAFSAALAVQLASLATMAGLALLLSIEWPSGGHLRPQNGIR